MKTFLLRTAWAPIAVLIFHQAIAHTSWRKPLDFTVHSLGGASMAFCAWHAIACSPRLIGRITAFASYLFSFCFAVTVGVFWEFIEQLSDTYRGSHIQISISETMGDLRADTTGASLALLLVMLVRFFCRKK